jgi:acetolactate synthase regulatory subunit
MNSLRITRLCSVAAVILIFAGGRAALAKVIATEEFENGTTRPVSVVVLPSQVTFAKQKMIRAEEQIRESGELEAHLTAAVAKEFRSRGYEVKVIDAAAIAADPALQELIVDSNRRFDELMTNVGARLAKGKNVRERQYNAGDEAKLIANRLDVDALAFARMTIVAPAAGVRALNLGMGGEQSMLTVTVVDGKSSDVEAYITLPAMQRGKMFGGHDAIIENPELQMGNYAAATLDDLHPADPSLRAQSSDEDVLSDLESLLE